MTSDAEAMIRAHNVEVWERGGLRLERIICLDCGGMFQAGTHFHEVLTEVRDGKVYHAGTRPFMEGLRYDRR